MEEITDCKSVSPPSVGEEFILWAEKYWSLKNAYSSNIEEIRDEVCPYEYLRKTFAEKIDQLIKSRLSL